MSSSLLQPPTSSSPQTAVKLTQQAPTFLSSQSSWLSRLPYPLSLFANTESQEKWQIYENIFLASLRTGDITTAQNCLQEIVGRFGQSNDRVLALRGMFQEAVAKDGQELNATLLAYEEILKNDPTNFGVRKQRAALLRNRGKTSDAITALTSILSTSPTDAETWAELGDLYLTQGAYDQAIYCFEEVLLVTPNAWNIHAKLGEVLYLYAGRLDGSGGSGGEQLKTLSESMRRLCRSIELCDDYLRGYYGLKLCTTRLLELVGTDNKKSQQLYSVGATTDLPPPTLDSIRKLNELSTSKLAEIVRKGSARTPGWDGYHQAELIAAKALLDKETQNIQR